MATTKNTKPWSDEEKKLVIFLLNDGFSYETIAERVNAKFGMKRTKNSISGIISRENKSIHDRRTKSNVRINKIKTDDDLGYPKISYGIKKHLLQIKNNECHYPLGRGMCCGAKVYRRDYCEDHFKLCFVVM